MRRTGQIRAADQLSLLGEDPEPVWTAEGAPAPRGQRPQGHGRPDWPPAWDADRDAVLRRLEQLEKWTVQETAFFLRCSTDHVYHLIQDGSVRAHNIARLPTSIPLYRVYRDSVRAFERSRMEGAHD